MQLLDGRSVSEQILNKIKLKIEDCGLKIDLHVILVGQNPSSLKYVSLKEKKCQEVGINFHLHHLSESTSSLEIETLINSLNQNPDVSGFFIQLPLPSSSPKDRLLSLINPDKDVDGLNPNSKFTPAVVKGIISLLNHYHLDFTHKNVVVINDSALIGQPLKKYFPQAILCNDQTKDLAAITKTADLLISATGVKDLVAADMVKEGSVVFDVANGDVDFSSVSGKTSFITPTFGGVGPMTIASLLENLVSVNG